MIGSIIDKYEVLQKLGEGATATVYRGRHLTIGKDVAIKVLHPHLSASSRYRERFNREARAVGRLAHQNIVSILDYSGNQADDCYIVTELVDGVTLLELLQDQGRLPSEIAAVLAMDLCSALGFAHTEGIIHRDIKPENVMIRRDGRVKLMDFGVARVMDEGSITIDGSLLGSPAYMSPQQALDEKLDGRSDLFSLGTVLFHAITGHVPFAGSNASVILRNIIEGNRPEVLELAPHASPGIAAVVDRLLQARAEDRYPTAADAHAALGACLAEVGLAPENPLVSLRGYLVNPQAATEALDAHLRQKLLEVGKDRLARKEQLGALQLFNRLLAIDEENAEVITLIQSLHQGPDTRRRPRWLAFVAAVAVLLSVAGGWAWWATRQVVTLPPAAKGHVDAAQVVDVVAPAPADRDEVSEQVEAVASVEPVTTERRAPRVVRLAEPRVAPEPAPVAADEPAKVLIDLKDDAWANVRVDGQEVGKIRRGRASDWVATKDRPLVLTPGTHEIELLNNASEPWRKTVNVVAGQRLELPVQLTKLKATVMIDAKIPGECNFAVDGVPYGTVDGMKRHVDIPDGDSQMVFVCPGREEFVVALPKLQPGETRWARP